VIDAYGYAVDSAEALFGPYKFARREPGAADVQIAIEYCGVCHSDLHFARGEWGGTVYPAVPGHEIVGRVVKVGYDVRKFREGDLVGVGCMVDSCRRCTDCSEGQEQYCRHGRISTYGAPDKYLGGMTQGGYSDSIVVDESFVLRIPEGLDPAAAAPLLCAGITTYSPLKQWKIGKGHRVGVVGLGGLGHMAMKIARAMGAEVVLFTTSPSKADDALRLGAAEIVISTDPDAMAKQASRFDFIFDTVAAPHDLDSLILALKRDGTLILLGAPAGTHPSPDVSNLLFQRRRIAGSLIGGIAETQEMLDFCAEHGIVSDIEIVPIQKIDEAFERMLKGDVKFRFVVDMASLKQ
jgi:uncharacterized zinc-type alcohol dehydrogenase-like protein